MLLQLSHCFSPLYSPPPCNPLPPSFPNLISCPWVVHISSLASPFPILFLSSTCLFCSCHLCFLFPVPFPPFSLLPTDNLPCDLHFCDSFPVLVVCLVYFCCFLGSVVDMWRKFKGDEVTHKVFNTFKSQNQSVKKISVSFILLERSVCS